MKLFVDTHEFRDQTKIFQAFAADQSTEYINSEDQLLDIQEQKEGDEYYFQYKILRSANKTIEIRRVIGVMEFLSEAGGLYEALFFIGAFLKFLFHGKDQALELLQNHFYVNQGMMEDVQNPKDWLSHLGSYTVSCFDIIFYGTILHRLCCFKSLKKRKFQKLIDQTNRHVNRALDVRSILRSQALLLALSRAVIDSKLYPLLMFQRYGNMIDTSTEKKDEEALLYGSEECM